jgi:hypothetical protein
MGFGAIILITIGALILIFILIEKSTKRSVQNEKEEVVENKNTTSKKVTPAKPKASRKDFFDEVKAWFSILLLAFLVALVALVIFKGVYNFLKERPVSGSGQVEEPSEPRNRSTSFEWVVDDSQTRIIDLCNGYQDTLHFGPDVRFNFVNSTVPYCVQNGDGLEMCGGKGEDLAFKLPKSSFGNRTLMFRAENDSVGTMTLYIGVKKYN